MQIWLQKRQFQNVRISVNIPTNVGKIPTLEHVTLVFELTSFTADMLGKLIEPRTERKKTSLEQEQAILNRAQSWNFHLKKMPTFKSTLRLLT